MEVLWQEKLEEISVVQEWQKDSLDVPAQERLEETSVVQDWQKDLARVAN